MDALILAAGYATRLYPLTLNRAKPLLPVGGKAIIDYLADGFCRAPEIERIYVVTNDKFYGSFREWRENRDFGKDVIVINDETKSDNDKLGAVGDIALVIEKAGIDNDLIVAAGDNIFGFDISDFIGFFKVHGLSAAAYRYPEKRELHHYGIVELDGEGRITVFREKPEDPKTNLVAVCLYGFPKDKLCLFSSYMGEGRNNDAPGYYLEWLTGREKVYAFTFNAPWYDIGTPDAYRRADEAYRDKGRAKKGGDWHG